MHLLWLVETDLASVPLRSSLYCGFCPQIWVPTRLPWKAWKSRWDWILWYGENSPVTALDVFCHLLLFCINQCLLAAIQCVWSCATLWCYWQWWRMDRCDQTGQKTTFHQVIQEWYSIHWVWLCIYVYLLSFILWLFNCDGWLTAIFCQLYRKNRSANSFKVESVPGKKFISHSHRNTVAYFLLCFVNVFFSPVKAVRCDTTVALFCPFKKPVRHCPR